MNTKKLLTQTGIHEEKLREFFTEFNINNKKPAVTEPVSILLFLNRSGSSMLSEHLRATGAFSGFGEPFNYKLVIERAQQNNLRTFREYLDWLMENIRVPGTHFGMKASLDQTLMLLRSGALPNFFADVNWIVVERADTLSQAISFSIAQQTRHWNSLDEPVNAPQPEYNFAELRELVFRFSDTYAATRILLASLGVPHHHLTYEQFVADPMNETKQLARALGVKNAEIDPTHLKLKKQARATNSAFKSRLVSDLRAEKLLP